MLRSNPNKPGIDDTAPTRGRGMSPEAIGIDDMFSRTPGANELRMWKAEEGAPIEYIPESERTPLVFLGGTTPSVPFEQKMGSQTPGMAHGGTVEDALHAVRHHLAGGGFLSDLFSGPDIMSTGSAPSPGDWGNPELASDFFKADKAMRLAREVQARADDVTGSVPAREPMTAPRQGVVKATELAPPPDQAFTPVRVEDLVPAPVNIPLNAPERGVPVMGASVAPASFATQPIAYSPDAPAAPAQAAIDEATKLTARAPQGPDLNDRQRDLIIRTIAAETSGKTPEESQAIAHVILNRIASGKYGASPEAVLFAKKQFEPWSNPNGANYPMRFSPESRRYGLGQTALDAALGAEDITKGATNFWAPKAQAALGRRPPKWGRTGGVDIGETRFHNLSRAEGGLVDDALHVVREHHADGEAVGPTMQQRLRETIASIDPERSQDQPVMDPATMGEAWNRARQNYQNFPVQEGEAVARQFVPSVRQEIGAAIAGEGAGRNYGSELRRRAAEFATGSSGLDNGMGALDFMPGTSQVLGATDIAHDIGQGDYAGAAEGAALPVAMTAAQRFAGPLGAAGRRAVEIAKDYAKPAAATAVGVAGATVAPDEAEAKSLSKVLQAIRAYQDPVAHKIADWNWRPLTDVHTELGLTKLPPHVQAFGDYMKEMSDKAGREGLSARDLLKGYTTTRASIQRRATDADNLRRLGLNLDPDVEKIRPEGAWMEWLGTPMGQRFLDEAAKGNISEDTVANAVKIMAPFGRHKTDIPNAMRWAAKNIPGREVAASDLVHRAAQGASTPEEWRNFTSDIRGVGPSKSGFLASLYGRGDQPTLDARQIILNTGEPTKLAAPFIARSGGQGGVEAVNRLAARQAALSLKAPSKYDPFYQHLAHHAIWDKASNEMTTHGDIIKGMRNYANGGSVEDRALMLVSKQA